MSRQVESKAAARTDAAPGWAWLVALLSVLSLLLAPSLAGVLPVQAQGPGNCPPVRVMPLGDSITYGYYGSPGDTRPPEQVPGYRQPLYLALTGAGYPVDFVGGLQAGQLVQPPFDPDHEGHRGWRDDQVAASVYQWLQANPADVVLLHIGTNELDESPDDVEDILNEIDRFSAGTTVFLARIINRNPPTTRVTTFNDNVQAMAEARIAAGDKIIIVDQESALNYQDDMANQLHPNQAGYEKMATVWFEALKGLLTPCGATPTPTPTPPGPTAIALQQTAEPPLVNPGDAVRFISRVTNPGSVALMDVGVSYDRCNPVTFLDGDANANGRLDPNETWTYECSTAVDAATTNTATATGRDSAGHQVSATASAMVRVRSLLYLPVVTTSP